MGKFDHGERTLSRDGGGELVRSVDVAKRRREEDATLALASFGEMCPRSRDLMNGIMHVILCHSV